MGLARDTLHREAPELARDADHVVIDGPPRVAGLMRSALLAADLVLIPAGSIFAFVRWASNNYGTVVSRIDIVRAVGIGEAHQTLPFVRPGGEILLRIDGWPKVERVLQAIDAVEAFGVDPCDAAPEPLASYTRPVERRG